MKKILSLILAICLILTMAPVVIYADEPTLGEATLLVDYTFDSDFMASDFAKAMVTDLTVENDAYTVSYPEDGGVRVERNANAGTLRTPVGKLAINFGKTIDAEKGIYQYGLHGVYAIDFTVKAKLVKTSSESGRTDCYLTGIINNTLEERPGNIRFLPDGKIQKDNSATKFTFKNRFSEEYKIYRIVVDTVNDKLYGYDFVDGAFVYTGEDTYTYESLASLAVSPRDAFLTEGSYIQFKNVKVYEYSDACDSDYANTFVNNMPDTFNYVSGGAVDTTAVTENIAFPESWADYAIESSDESVTQIKNVFHPFLPNENLKEIDINSITNQNSAMYQQVVVHH